MKRKSPKIPPITPVPKAEAPRVKAAKSIKLESQKLERRWVQLCAVSSQTRGQR